MVNDNKNKNIKSFFVLDADVETIQQQQGIPSTSHSYQILENINKQNLKSNIAAEQTLILDKMVDEGLSNKKLYHTTTHPDAINSIRRGINIEKTDSDSRFGKAYYLAEIPETSIAEVQYHNKTGVHTIQYNFHHDKAKLLDLTKPEVAASWDYQSGVNQKQNWAIAEKAKEKGFEGILFSSERGKGINLAIFKNFDKFLEYEKYVEVKNIASLTANKIIDIQKEELTYENDFI